MCAERMRINEADPANKLCVIYKDHKIEFGLNPAWVNHSRTNVVALPIVSEPALLKTRKAGEFHKRKKGCLFCAILAEEKKAQGRVIEETRNFIAFCP